MTAKVISFPVDAVFSPMPNPPMWARDRVDAICGGSDMTDLMQRALAEEMRRQDLLDEMRRRFDADEPLTPAIDEFLVPGMDERYPVRAA